MCGVCKARCVCRKRIATISCLKWTGLLAGLVGVGVAREGEEKKVEGGVCNKGVGGGEGQLAGLGCCVHLGVRAGGVPCMLGHGM